MGVVSSQRAGRTHGYRLNTEHLAARPIAMLADLHGELISRLRRNFDEWVEPPVYAALFGSTARGDMTATSDIDLFIVHRDTAELDDFQQQVDDLSARVTRWTGNDTRPLTYAATEVGPGDPIFTSILNQGQTLYGDRVWLTRAIRKAGS